MKIAVIILHFGDVQVTRTCIASLFTHETSPFSVLVVNNMPTSYLPKDFTKEKIIVINNKKNFGFAKGVNIGIKKALEKKTDIVVLLNNDTSIQKPFLRQFVKELQQKSVGILGPAIAFTKNGQTMFDVGGKINHLFFRTQHEEVNSLKHYVTHPVEYVSGCCMAIKKEVFQTIGLFDESFFLYYEDVDFCLRARKMGFLTVVVPKVVISHLLSKSKGATSSFTIYHLLVSNILFGKKYERTLLQKFAHRLFVLFQAILFVKANPSAATSIIRSLLSS